jgi:hypothetical protein
VGGLLSHIMVSLEDTTHTFVEGCRRGGDP